MLTLELEKYCQSSLSHSIQECWGLKKYIFILFDNWKETFLVLPLFRIHNGEYGPIIIFLSLTFETMGKKVQLHLKEIFQK